MNPHHHGPADSKSSTPADGERSTSRRRFDGQLAIRCLDATTAECRDPIRAPHRYYAPDPRHWSPDCRTIAIVFATRPRRPDARRRRDTTRVTPRPRHGPEVICDGSSRADYVGPAADPDTADPDSGVAYATAIHRVYASTAQDVVVLVEVEDQEESFEDTFRLAQVIAPTASLWLNGRADLVPIGDDAPDASYLYDLSRVYDLLGEAHRALVEVVAAGRADHDSDAGALTIRVGDEVGALRERVTAALDDPEYRTRGLLRGRR